MQLRNHRYMVTQRPIYIQEMNSKTSAMKITLLGKMKQESTWKLSQTSLT